MRRDPRKQPWQTFPFWFLILSGMAMTVAWKLDLLRPGTAEIATEEQAVEEEIAPDWASESIEEADVVAESEESLEPASEEETPRSFPDGEEPAISDAEEIPEQGEPAAEMESAVAASTEEPVAEEESPAGLRLMPAKQKEVSEAATEIAATTDKSTPVATNSLKSRTSQSPFGPARVEIQGIRRGGPKSLPAESATWAKDPPEEGKTSEEIVQTAATGGDDASQIQTLGQDGNDDASPPKEQERPTSASAAFDFSAIDRLIQDGEDVEANFQLSNLYWKRPELRRDMEERLRGVSYRIYFAPDPHYMDGYVVQNGDMLQKIAKQYDVSWEYLAKLNRTDPKKIRSGQTLKVIRGPFSAVVDLSDMELTVHAHGHYVHAFPVGIGQDNTSPIGTFKIQEKLRDPTYYGPNGVIEHDDPKNPLGEYWLDLGDGYGIHGTIDESSIGKAESQGCIRLNNRDIASVYDLLTVGSEVIIRR